MSNGEQVARPSKVATAVMLLYVTLGIEIIISIIESSRLAEASSIGFVIFVQLFVFVIWWFFIYMIGKGRNWARVTFLGLAILGAPLSILSNIESLTHDPISGVLGLVLATIEVIALVFLFQGASSAWFWAMKNLKTENAQQGAPADS